MITYGRFEAKTALLFATATFFGYYSLSQSALQNRQALSGASDWHGLPAQRLTLSSEVDVELSGKPVCRMFKMVSIQRP